MGNQVVFSKLGRTEPQTVCVALHSAVFDTVSKAVDWFLVGIVWGMVTGAVDDAVFAIVSQSTNLCVMKAPPHAALEPYLLTVARC
jgi:hypothetical protein